MGRPSVSDACLKHLLVHMALHAFGVGDGVFEHGVRTWVCLVWEESSGGGVTLGGGVHAGRGRCGNRDGHEGGSATRRRDWDEGRCAGECGRGSDSGTICGRRAFYAGFVTEEVTVGYRW